MARFLQRAHDVNGDFLATGDVTAGGNATVDGNLVVSGTLNQKPPLVSGSGATVTLTAAQSGGLFLFDRAAGIIYTLPAPAVGLYFDFLCTVSVTSNNATVITNVGTVFVSGSVINIKTDGTLLGCIGNGTSHIKIQSNGTTTGGLLGSQYRLTCVSSTVWLATGNVLGSGTIATPFA